MAIHLMSLTGKAAEIAGYVLRLVDVQGDCIMLAIHFNGP